MFVYNYLCAWMICLMGFDQLSHIDVCIDLRGVDAGVSQKALHDPEIHACLEEVSRKAMTEGVWRDLSI